MPIPPFVPSEDPSQATKARAAEILFAELQTAGTLYQSDAVSILYRSFGQRYYERTATGHSIDRGVLNAFRNLYKPAGGHWYARKAFWKIIPRRYPAYQPRTSDSGTKMRFRARV